jgi:hypothetical protein
MGGGGDNDLEWTRGTIEVHVDLMFQPVPLVQSVVDVLEGDDERGRLLDDCVLAEFMLLATASTSCNVEFTGKNDLEWTEGW